MTDLTPEATHKNIQFWPIPEVPTPECVFGPKAPTTAYFDRYDRPDVPRQFQRMADDLFFVGGTLPDGLCIPEWDRVRAMKWVRSRLTSWGVAHEAKISTVAYAFWVWSTPEIVNAPAK